MFSSIGKQDTIKTHRFLAYKIFLISTSKSKVGLVRRHIKTYCNLHRASRALFLVTLGIQMSFYYLLITKDSQNYKLEIVEGRQKVAQKGNV